MKKCAVYMLPPLLALMTGCSQQGLPQASLGPKDLVIGTEADAEDEVSQDACVSYDEAADDDQEGQEDQPADEENENKEDSETVCTEPLTISIEEESDSIELPISIEDFEKLGFKLGDSVDVAFGNGKSYEDIPYYNGDYCRIYEYYLYANKNHDCIAVCCNCKPDFGIEEGIKGDDTVTITLHEEGRYEDTQKRLDLTYSNKPEDYPTEEAYANFRSLSGGDIVSGRFYRGASPCNNNTNRSNYVNTLMRKNKIAFVLDLSDNRDTFESYRDQYGENYTYDWDLFLNDKVAFVDMNSDYTNEEYKEWIAQGLIELTENDGPYFIHCNEGMDRTGFVSVILEGLAGATYKQMRDDYMLTYRNYYGIDKESDPETYDLIVRTYFDSFLIILHDEEADHDELKEIDFKEDIERYLMEGGMTDKQVKKLKKLLTEA